MAQWKRQRRYGAARLKTVSSGNTFDITQLPVAAQGLGDWNALAAAGGTSLAVNSTWTCSTGVPIRRLTNASTPVGNTSCGILYTTGGRDVSRRYGAGNDTVHVIYEAFGSGGRMMNYQRGVGVLSDVSYTLSSTSRLAYCFSKKASEPHILYFATDGSGVGAGTGAKLHRYDVNAGAYAANSIFTGATASIDIYGQYVYWCQQTWDGTCMSLHTTDAGGDTYAVQYIELDTGTIYTYAGVGDAFGTSYSITAATQANPCQLTLSGSLTGLNVGDYLTISGVGGMTALNGQYVRVLSKAGANITIGGTANTWANVNSTGYGAYTSGGSCVKTNNLNDMRIGADSGLKFCALAGNARDKAFWFPVTNHVTAWTQQWEGYGHSDGLLDAYIAEAADGTIFFQRILPGTDPGEGAAWNGSKTNVATNQSGVPVLTGDYHPGKGWVQPYTGTDQYFVLESEDSLDNLSLTTWTLHSGSIYKCTATFTSYMGGADSISGVYKVSGSNFIGHMVKAASLGAMVSGTYFYDPTGNVIYVWHPSGDPTGLVRPVAYGRIGLAFGAIRMSNDNERLYCYTYQQPDTYVYEKTPFHCQSPDGDLLFFTSSLGVNAGRTDVFCAELPVI
jgi:hypothetical protein